MYKKILELKSVMDISMYSLKDLALYFELLNDYVCKITTSKRIIIFKINVSYLPHLIGLHHIFKGVKNKNEYKGFSGFEKMKNGEITYNDLIKLIKNNNTGISWKNIKDRIKYLLMFFNTIINKNTKLKIRNDDLFVRQTSIKGNYFLYKNFLKCYPMISLKKLTEEKVILETFIVENNITLLGALPEEKIKSIELIDPLVMKKNKTLIH